MLTIGQEAPQFNLKDFDGNIRSNPDYAGKRIVLYFYPKDDTPGCTVEAKDFSALASKFAASNTVVIGVSKDSVQSHCDFRDKYELKITLLSDPEGQTLMAYDAWGEKSNYGKTYMGIIRSTVVIGTDGKVEKIWKNVKAAGHAEKVLAYIQEKL